MRSEHVIASSWRALVLPPCPRHSISPLDEICGRLLPSRSRQCLPLRVTLSASADVAAECLVPIAAIKAHHIIPVYGTVHRHRRGPNLLRLTRLSKLTDRPMNEGNQIGKLIRPQPMVPHIVLDDFRC